MSDETELTTADLAGREAPDEADVGEARDEAEGAGADGAGLQPLLPGEEAESFRGRWTELQTRFVDEPKEAVQGADALVAELMKRLAESFAGERETLEQQWSGGGEASTEDLRVALQRYRSFFERLLST